MSQTILLAEVAGAAVRILNNDQRPESERLLAELRRSLQEARRCREAAVKYEKQAAEYLARATFPKDKGERRRASRKLMETQGKAQANATGEVAHLRRAAGMAAGYLGPDSGLPALPVQ